MKADRLENLQMLFDDEKAALLAGDYGKLAAVSEAKEVALNQILAERPNQQTLRKIKAQLDANQSLSAAALRGVKAARTRLTDLESVRDHLTTYGPSGKVTQVHTQRSRIEKKS